MRAAISSERWGISAMGGPFRFDDLFLCIPLYSLIPVSRYPGKSDLYYLENHSRQSRDGVQAYDRAEAEGDLLHHSGSV